MWLQQLLLPRPCMVMLTDLILIMVGEMAGEMVAVMAAEMVAETEAVETEADPEAEDLEVDLVEVVDLVAQEVEADPVEEETVAVEMVDGITARETMMMKTVMNMETPLEGGKTIDIFRHLTHFSQFSLFYTSP